MTCHSPLTNRTSITFADLRTHRMFTEVEVILKSKHIKQVKFVTTNLIIFPIIFKTQSDAYCTIMVMFINIKLEKIESHT